MNDSLGIERNIAQRRGLLSVDACLDHGGRWDYDRNVWEDERSWSPPELR